MKQNRGMWEGADQFGNTEIWGSLSSYGFFGLLGTLLACPVTRKLLFGVTGHLGSGKATFVVLFFGYKGYLELHGTSVRATELQKMSQRHPTWCQTIPPWLPGTSFSLHEPNLDFGRPYIVL